MSVVKKQDTLTAYCRLKFCLCLILFACAFFSSPKTVRAEEARGLSQANPVAVKGRAAASLNKLRYELSLQKEIIKDTSAQFADMQDDLNANLQRAQAEIQRLYSLYHIFSKSALMRTNITQQLKKLDNEFKVISQPFETIVIHTRQWQDSLKILTEQANAPVAGSALGVENNQESIEQQQIIMSMLGEAQENVNELAAQITPYSEEVRFTQEILKSILAETSDSLPYAWRSYYIQSTDITSPAEDAIASPLRKWRDSLASSIMYAHPQTPAAWAYSGSMFAVGFLVMCALGVLVVLCGRHIGNPWDYIFRSTTLRTWILLALGSGFLLAATGPHGGTYVLLKVAGVLLLMFGIIFTCRLIRKGLYPELAAITPSLNLMFIPAALGLLMLYSEMPYKTLNAAWSCIIILFLCFMIVIIRKQQALSVNIPALEKYAPPYVLLFSFISLIFSLMGLGRLGVVVYFAFYAVLVLLTVTDILCNFAQILTDRFFEQNNRHILYASIKSLILPLALLLAIGVCLPWLWAFPGSEYIGKIFLLATFSLGDLKFGLHRMAFILTIWFVARIFISISHAALDELPQNNPGFVEATIPTLKKFMSYAVWTIFVLVSIEAFGVSLTSLTFIVGGLSVGIGFGLQAIFNNLLSGIMLILGRDIMVGDVIKSGSTSGIVREINIRSTTIETPDNSLAYIPNANIMTNEFINLSRTNRHVEAKLTVRLLFQADEGEAIQKRKKARLKKDLLAIAASQKHVLRAPVPLVIEEEGSQSEIRLALHTVIDDKKYVDLTMHAMEQEIAEILRDEQKIIERD